MKRMLIISLVTVLTFSLIFGASGFVSSETKYTTVNGEDPWGEKEVLNYLLQTADEKLQQDVQRLQVALDLSSKQMDGLKEVALLERKSIMSIAGKGHLLNALEFNDQASRAFAGIDREVQESLGEKYEDFRKWVRDWWQEEKKYRQKWLTEQRQKTKSDVGIMTSDRTERELVFATQYHGFTTVEVALPDKYVKFANRGWWGNIPETYRHHYSNPP